MDIDFLGVAGWRAMAYASCFLLHRQRPLFFEPK